MISIGKLKALTSKRDKIFLALLFVLSVGLSFIETIGISAIMPFISLATNPDLITTNEYSAKFYEFFSFKNTNSFIVVFGVILIVFYIFRAIYTMFYAYLLNRFAFGRFHIFALKLFTNYAYLPYKRFVRRNSGEMSKIITQEAFTTSVYLQNFLQLFSEGFTIVLLYILLLFVNVKMTLVLTIFLGIKVYLIMKILTNKIKEQGRIRSTAFSKFYKILNETFGNFKLIKLMQNEEQMKEKFIQASSQMAQANIVNSTLSQLPRNILETIGLSVLIAIVLYTLLKYNDASAVLPIISMYALALYRMLPALNRILSNYNNIVFYSKSLDIVYKELKYQAPFEGSDSLEFSSKLKVENLSFNYEYQKPVLEDINLEIKKGEKIAFIGESGSGKSTLVDIIIGIYKSKDGKIFIDGKELNDNNIRSWRAKIGYIPQSIYLFDGSVEENVAFGYEIDKQKVEKCLKQANIWEFLKGKNGAQTLVGEGGIQLSGGQKQRIGIARALYNDPEILVLDEATSALDDETEAKIMDEIYNVVQNKTLLIIAHRLSTTERCDKKIRLEKGKIVEISA